MEVEVEMKVEVEMEVEIEMIGSQPAS